MVAKRENTGKLLKGRKVETIKQNLEEISSILSSISKFEYNQVSKKERETLSVTHPAFRLGYAMAYEMAAYRVNELLNRIGSLPVE
jgi:uncharacterized membrane protein